MELTVGSVINSLAKAVKLKGEDYIYESSNIARGPRCTYASPKADRTVTPDCIVGHVLADHGVSLDDLQYTSLINNGKYSTGLIKDLAVDLRHDGIEIDETALAILARAQRWQDDGYTWGESVEHGLDAVL